MLIAIFLAALAGVAMQSNNGSREIVEPVIAYILKDYDIEEKIATFAQNIKQSESLIPVSGNVTMQTPCEYIELVQKYGWYWDPTVKKQSFYPGLSLKVKENTMVKPLMAGQVETISEDNNGRTLILQHNDQLCSIYSGLKEVFVEEKDIVDLDDILGKSNAMLYLEMRNQDGPLNINYLFE